MASTKAQMREKVLRYLSRLPEGQDPEAHEASIVDDAIDQAQSYLETQGIAYWATSAIPDAVATAYCRFVGAQVAPELMDAQSATPFMSIEQRALETMRSVTASANGRTKATYF